ncbi:MAG: PrsW family glutamic-type intramembrane protease [Planctomycetota bacterium]
MLWPTLFLYLSLALCSVGIAAAVVRYDLYKQESWTALALVAALGAGSMWLAGQAQLGVIHVLSSNDLLIDNIQLALLAGSTEELGKLLAVLLLFLLARRAFDEPLDGLIYGSFAGLGAAIEESVVVLGKVTPALYLPPQEPVRLAGHLVMGGIGAFGLGLLTTRSRWAFPVIAACLAGAILLHTAWDVAAFSAADLYRIHGKLLPWHTVTPIVLMLGGMLVYRWFAGIGARMVRAHLQICDVKTRECPPSPPNPRS